ncbi:MAG: LysR family transcriptional regulator [Acidobacteria bacterium]|nr:LysR family transcriptional regulator [Acidobacteriota bacterium]
MHNVNWDALQAFLAVARTGRISVAARRLDVEHTTISRRLTALEANLGVPLFYRTNTGYTLTAHGRNALTQAQAMERAALALTARAREGSGVIAGRVRVAMAPEFASHWLGPQLKVFRAKHPQIKVHILVGTRQRDLSRGEAELAVQSPRPRQKDLVAVRIGHTSLALYASKTIVTSARWRITARETLRGLPLLTYTTSFQMLQEAKWFQAVLSSVGAYMETNSTHALLAAARAGVGVAVLPRFVARWHDDLVDVSDAVAAHDVWLITHPEFRRDPKVRATADFLKGIALGPDGLC